MFKLTENESRNKIKLIINNYVKFRYLQKIRKYLT